MTRPSDGGPDLKQYGNMKKVVKFGGSSLADAAQFKKVAEIIHADESRVYVIPSAPGKRFSGDTKVTDLLYHMYEEAKEKKLGEAPGEVFAAISLALHEHNDMHDLEDTVLTITRVKRSYSPWSSKIYTLRETPKK